MSKFFSFDTVFCLVKRRLIEVTEAQVVAETVVDWMGWYRLKGVETLSVPTAHYSLGWRMKKKAIQVRSAIVLFLGEPLLATDSMQWRMEMGRGRTLPGAGYSFSYVANCCPRQNSIVPMLLSLGSESSTAAKICHTEHMYCYTLRLLMGLWLAARTPVRTL